MLLYIHRIAKALNNCNASTSDIVDTTERLKQELEITTQRQEIVSCFLRDYQLSNEEVYTYYYASLPNLPQNFSAFL